MIRDTVRVETLHIEMHSPDALRLLLMTREGAAQAHVELSAAESAALPHVAAICGHAPSCPGRVEVLTNLLVRVLTSLGRQRPAVIVRPGDRPVFWLHVPGATPLELELSRIDALVLLVSERTDVAVEIIGAQEGQRTPTV